MDLMIRVDSDYKIGTGHIMRCIALAQAWKNRGGKATFISRCESGALRKRIQDEGFRMIDLPYVWPDASDMKRTVAALKSGGADRKNWLILDGYHFTPEYQRLIRVEGIKLLVIDDMRHLARYHADILLNQNIYGPELNYSCDKDTVLLLGTKYALLRREFLKYRGFERRIPDRAKIILVTLGGADPDNATLKVVDALKLLDEQDITVKIIIGPVNRHKEELQKAIASARFDAELLVNPPNMPELMIGSDLTISGGSTCWELAFTGSPAIVGRISGAEELLIRGLCNNNLFVDCGWFKELVSTEFAGLLVKCIADKEWRAAMNKRGPDIIDGRGSERVVDAILEFDSN